MSIDEIFEVSNNRLSLMEFYVKYSLLRNSVNTLYIILLYDCIVMKI